MTLNPVHGGAAVFRSRFEAGRVLGELLNAYQGRDDVIVLGLARGGVPVAWQVAHALGAPLDCFIVRKLGVPGHEEFAMGAPESTCREFAALVDDVVCASMPTPFLAVGASY